MKKRHIYLFLVIILVLFLPSYIIIQKIIYEQIITQREEDIKLLQAIFPENKRPTFNEIKSYLGQPNYIFQREDYPDVKYKNHGCSNSGYVAVWDTENWYGKGFYLTVQFDRKTNTSWGCCCSLTITNK